MSFFCFAIVACSLPSYEEDAELAAEISWMVIGGSVGVQVLAVGDEQVGSVHISGGDALRRSDAEIGALMDRAIRVYLKKHPESKAVLVTVSGKRNGQSVTYRRSWDAPDNVEVQ